MLHKLPSPKTKQAKPQVGRGMGRRGGHTTGRGTKGQKSRSGYTRPRPGFEGGQMPLSRRLPKLKGFSRGFKVANLDHQVVQLSEVAEAAEGTVTIEKLLEWGFIRSLSKKVSVKVLFDQEISQKLDFEGVMVSKKAKEAIEKVGGSVKYGDLEVVE